MKRLGVIVVGTLWLFGCREPEGRLILFNGRDLTGWVSVLDEASVKPDSVWSVHEGVIRCQGVPQGYLRTTDSFADYRLHFEWRWPDKPTNSGVLIHCQAPDRIWPNAIECQLAAGYAGDLVLFGPARGMLGDSIFAIQEETRVLPKRHPSSEKPAGEWNTCKITALGDKLRITINGVVQNEARIFFPLSGPIALQSEGSPIDFRNIVLESLDGRRE